MAEVIRYVDTDATGSGTGVDWANAYTSLSAWEAAEQTDLVSDGDWHHVYCRASSGTADTTGVAINGWTTDSTHYILVEAASGDEAVKSGWGTTRYRLSTTSMGITTDLTYIHVKGLQIETGGDSCFYINSTITGSNYIYNCYLRNTTSGFAGAYLRGNPNLYVWNNIIESLAYGIMSRDTTGTLYAYNNIVYNCSTVGIRQRGIGTLISTNNASFNNPDDFVQESGTLTIDHCASDDGDGTNAVSPSGGDWDNEFVDPANGDFTLLNTGNCYHGGTENSPDSTLYTTDMEGDPYGI